MPATPSFDDLLALVLGECGPEQAAAVRSGVVPGSPAAATLARLAAFVAAAGTEVLSEPPADLVSRTTAALQTAPERLTLTRLAAAVSLRLEEWTHVAATLIFDGAAPVPGFRSGGSGDATVRMAYSSPVGALDLEIRHVAPGPGRAVRGQFAALTGDLPRRVYLLRVDEAGHEPLDAEVDSTGRFALLTGPGRYDVVVRCERALVTLCDVNME